MTDEEMYKILEDFANNHTLAENIKVEMSSHHTSYKPRDVYGSRYEDVVFLSRIIDGATSFMFWLRREGKARLVKCPRKGVKLAVKGRMGRKKKR